MFASVEPDIMVGGACAKRFVVPVVGVKCTIENDRCAKGIRFDE